MNGKRVKVGVSGLDEMLGGGLLAGSICAIIGTYEYRENDIFPRFYLGRAQTR